MAIEPSQAGWWSGSQGRGNLGDSFLYAGYFDSQPFISAARFDLSRLPRGAPLLEVSLRLAGLNADRFDPGAGGTWMVQLLAEKSVPDLARVDFQTLFNAPPAATLFPTLYPVDLAAGNANAFALDKAARDWLAGQINEGAKSIIARIMGPGGANTLFAWDSGVGPATTGEGPELLISLGPPPATPPPLPTERVLVATLTPTPANVLTAAANALAATSAAGAPSSTTPLPYRIVTPTPLPANAATAEALAYQSGMVPIVVYTPTPANSATATAYAAYATAVAVTTGTFTPVPTGAVTPVIILPTPMPENVATAAVQMLNATAQAGQIGTVTPLPSGVVIATVTATPPVVASTPTPANRATMAAYAVYATAVAITTGTFTPTPPTARTPTPDPTETPLPLMVEITPLATSTPSPTPPAAMPAALTGKILFYSDRNGSTQLYALDPAKGRLTWVTRDWPYALAQARENRSPDERYSVTVQTIIKTARNRATGGTVDRSTTQVFVHDNLYNTARQLTDFVGQNYDPVWSPAGDRIAFVSQEAGNDEVYLISPDGSGLQRLTSNTWEWDKHPSWSPDGKQIVFFSNRETGRRQLWVMNADGSDQRPLLNSPFNDWDPIWVK